MMLTWSLFVNGVNRYDMKLWLLIHDRLLFFFFFFCAIEYNSDYQVDKYTSCGGYSQYRQKVLAWYIMQRWYTMTKCIRWCCSLYFGLRYLQGGDRESIAFCCCCCCCCWAYAEKLPIPILLGIYNSNEDDNMCLSLRLR